MEKNTHPSQSPHLNQETLGPCGGTPPPTRPWGPTPVAFSPSQANTARAILQSIRPPESWKPGKTENPPDARGGGQAADALGIPDGALGQKEAIGEKTGDV